MVSLKFIAPRRHFFGLFQGEVPDPSKTWSMAVNVASISEIIRSKYPGVCEIRFNDRGSGLGLFPEPDHAMVVGTYEDIVKIVNSEFHREGR